MIDNIVSIASIFGWLGAMLYLLSHSYISYNANWNRQVYYVSNLVAAMLVIVSSVIFSSWQVVVTNCLWAIISLLLFCDVKLRYLPVSPSVFRTIMVLFWGWIMIFWIKDGDISLELLGWTSVFVFSVAYFLFSIERMPSRYYFLWSTYAASALLPQLWLEQNWPIFILYIIWVGVSLLGAMRRFAQYRLIGRLNSD